MNALLGLTSKDMASLNDSPDQTTSDKLSAGLPNFQSKRIKAFLSQNKSIIYLFLESQHYKVNQNDSDSSVDEEADILRKFDEIMLQKE